MVNDKKEMKKMEDKREISYLTVKLKKCLGCNKQLFSFDSDTCLSCAKKLHKGGFK